MGIPIRTVLSLIWFLICLHLLPQGCHAYRHGDPIPMLKRSQYKGQRTEWSEMLGRNAPLYGIDRTVTLNPIADAKSGYSTTEEFKIAFSFANDRLLTPWITVTDGHGIYLDRIECIFYYTGNYLVRMSTVTRYHPEEQRGIKPEHIYLTYRWQEIVTTDSSFGLNFMLIVGVTAAWIIGLVISCGWDRRRSVKLQTR